MPNPEGSNLPDFPPYPATLIAIQENQSIHDTAIKAKWMFIYCALCGATGAALGGLFGLGAKLLSVGCFECSTMVGIPCTDSTLLPSAIGAIEFGLFGSGYGCGRGYEEGEIVSRETAIHEERAQYAEIPEPPIAMDRTHIN